MVSEHLISFNGLSSAEANIAASSLREALMDLGLSGVSVRVERQSTTSMDSGTALALVLGAPAAVAVARGIANWLTREGDRAGEVIINTRAGSVLVRGPASKTADVAAIVAALTGAKE